MGADRAVRLRLVVAFVAFVLIGAGDGGLGVLLPSIQRFYGIDKATVSLLFLCGTSGYLVAAFTSGPLVGRLGTRLFLALGVGAFVVGAASIGLALPFVVVLACYVVFAFGFGVLDAGLNTYIAGLPNNTGTLNNLHACYGLGALAGPVVAQTFLDVRLGWNAVYIAWAGAAMLVLASTWLVFQGVGRVRHEAGPGQGGNVLAATLRLRVVWIVAVFLLLYVGGEVSLGNWSYSLLTEERAVDPNPASWFVSGYWMGLTVGRLVLGRLARRLGDRNLIQLCLAGVMAGLLLVWLPPWPVAAAVGLWLTGFSLGPIFPTAIAVLSRLVAPRVLPSAIGFVASAGSAGAAFFPWIAGNLAEGLGLWTLLPYVVLLSTVMWGVWLLLMRVPYRPQKLEAPEGLA
ncbi:MAG TPA: MFS transporter [Chloroflexia bacterium]|jgi:fucose permease